MDDIFEKEENAKNIYVIKHKLSELKKVPGESYYEWEIGPFVVKFFEPRDLDYMPYVGIELPEKPEKKPVRYLTMLEKIDVYVYEKSKRYDNLGNTIIDLMHDPRFANYKPIQYSIYQTPMGTTINSGDGRSMPMNCVCELIRYLHRLANLTAFM